MSAVAGEGTMIEPPMVPGIVHLHSERRAVATVDKLEGLPTGPGDKPREDAKIEKLTITD